jgi:hypothetical protein
MSNPRVGLRRLYDIIPKDLRQLHTRRYAPFSPCPPRLHPTRNTHARAKTPVRRGLDSGVGSQKRNFLSRRRSLLTRAEITDPHRLQSQSRFLAGPGGIGPAAIIFRSTVSLTRYPIVLRAMERSVAARGVGSQKRNFSRARKPPLPSAYRP